MADPQDLQASFVEDTALLMEERGLPRIAGRIFALLLVTPGELSLEELAQRLGVSRASISTDARRLQQIGVIERVGRPGDRKDYYRIAPDHHVRGLEHALEGITRMEGILERTIAEPGTDPVVQDRLRETLRVHKDIFATLRDKLEQWRSTTSGPKSARPDAA